MVLRYGSIPARVAIKAFQQFHMPSLSEARLGVVLDRAVAFAALRLEKKSSLASGEQASRAWAVGAHDQNEQAIVSQTNARGGRDHHP